jgi:hypothetical protein
LNRLNNYHNACIAQAWWLNTPYFLKKKKNEGVDGADGAVPSSSSGAPIGEDQD